MKLFEPPLNLPILVAARFYADCTVLPGGARRTLSVRLTPAAGTDAARERFRLKARPGVPGAGAGCGCNVSNPELLSW